MLGSEGKLDNGTSVHRLQSAQKQNLWLCSELQLLGGGGGGGGGE